MTGISGTGVNNTNSYDGDGNRIGLNTALGNYSYLNDTASGLPVVLNEQGSDGNITFTYGANLIEEASSTFNYFYGYDGFGSVVGLTDGATGKAVSAYAYDAWGNATSNGSVGMKDKFRFTGEALDPGTGLYFLRARYYDPAIGRLLSKDSFSGPLRVPLNSNKYIYALNRPTVLSDPTGFAAEETPGGGPLLIANLPPVFGNSNSTTAIAREPSYASYTETTSVIEAACAVVGVVQTIFETTSDFLATGAIHYIASNGDSQPVSNVPCYSNLPGVGLFFTSVPTAH